MSSILRSPCREAHLLATTDDVYTLGSGKVAEEVAVVGLELSLLRTHENIMVLESQGLRLAIELHALGHALGRNIIVAPVEHHHRIDEESQHKVDKYTTYHDEQSLPGRFAAKLIGLLGLFHLFGIEALVYHARNLTISAQRQPSQTISGV